VEFVQRQLLLFTFGVGESANPNSWERFYSWIEPLTSVSAFHSTQMRRFLEAIYRILEKSPDKVDLKRVYTITAEDDDQ